MEARALGQGVGLPVSAWMAPEAVDTVGRAGRPHPNSGSLEAGGRREGDEEWVGVGELCEGGRGSRGVGRGFEKEVVLAVCKISEWRSSGRRPVAQT